MDSNRLFYLMKQKDTRFVDILLSDINLHRRSIEVVSKRLENMKSTNPSYESSIKILKLSEDGILNAKQTLLRTVANNAFEVISEL